MPGSQARLRVRPAASSCIRNLLCCISMPTVGMRVRVHGLQKKPEYNDLTGSVKREVEGGRWCIVLDKVGIELALKPDNFTQSELPKAAAEKGEAVCANADCRAQLVPPLQHCARCKAVAYCSKGVGCRA